MMSWEIAREAGPYAFAIFIMGIAVAALWRRINTDLEYERKQSIANLEVLTQLKNVLQKTSDDLKDARDDLLKAIELAKNDINGHIDHKRSV